MPLDSSVKSALPVIWRAASIGSDWFELTAWVAPHFRAKSSREHF